MRTHPLPPSCNPVSQMGPSHVPAARLYHELVSCPSIPPRRRTAATIRSHYANQSSTGRVKAFSLAVRTPSNSTTPWAPRSTLRPDRQCADPARVYIPRSRLPCRLSLHQRQIRRRAGGAGHFPSSSLRTDGNCFRRLFPPLASHLLPFPTSFRSRPHDTDRVRALSLCRTGSVHSVSLIRALS